MEIVVRSLSSQFSSASKSMDFTLFLTLFVFALLSTQTIDGFTVELIHPNSPSNPYRNPSNNRFDWIRQMHNNSQSRAATIQSRLGVDSSSKFKINIKPLGGGYVMKYSIGTPPFETYGIVDTGSDFTWIQCEPCTDCFPQSVPIFDPKHSKSYKTVVCNDSDTTCSLRDGFHCSNNNVCQYDMSYDGYFLTVGDVATDTVTIGDASFKNVVLGCGHQNKFKFSNVTASGVFGLGYSNVSIIKELRKEIGGKFAHCLSPQSDSKSYISFGADAIVEGPDTILIDLLISPVKPFHYWLTLKSMSVGDKNFPVELPPLESYGNIIIDSGTTVTRIPPDVFDGMKSELMKHINDTPIDDPQGLFGLCYSTTTTKSVKIKVPKIVAHFTGGDVELSPRGLFEEVEEGISCLTIVPNNMMGLSIFGCQSQVDYLVGFDLEFNAVTFKPADCSKF
nr:aspartic proteinase CDR1-like [Ipomoea batatas]